MKKALITILIIILCIAIAIISLFIIKKTALDRAVRNLDVENSETAVRVMKLGGKNEKYVNIIADAYFEAGCKKQAAILSLYVIQYIDKQNQSALDRIGACYEPWLATQFTDADIKTEEFEAITESAGYGYGIKNGIYCEFLEGYAKAKISPALPLEIFASKDGVYYLDSSDNVIKFINCDGSGLSIAVEDKASEFVYHNGRLYYIDMLGKLHGAKEIALQEGQQVMDLRIESNEVVCTIFDKEFEIVKTQKLEAS